MSSTRMNRPLDPAVDPDRSYRYKGKSHGRSVSDRYDATPMSSKERRAHPSTNYGRAGKIITSRVGHGGRSQDARPQSATPSTFQQRQRQAQEPMLLDPGAFLVAAGITPGRKDFNELASPSKDPVTASNIALKEEKTNESASRAEAGISTKLKPAIREIMVERQIRQVPCHEFSFPPPNMTSTKQKSLQPSSYTDGTLSPTSFTSEAPSTQLSSSGIPAAAAANTTVTTEEARSPATANTSLPQELARLGIQEHASQLQKETSHEGDFAMLDIDTDNSATAAQPPLSATGSQRSGEVADILDEENERLNQEPLTPNASNNPPSLEINGTRYYREDQIAARSLASRHAEIENALPSSSFAEPPDAFSRNDRAIIGRVSIGVNTLLGNHNLPGRSRVDGSTQAAQSLQSIWSCSAPKASLWPQQPVRNDFSQDGAPPRKVNPFASTGPVAPSILGRELTRQNSSGASTTGEHDEGHFSNTRRNSKSVCPAQPRKAAKSAVDGISSASNLGASRWSIANVPVVTALTADEATIETVKAPAVDQHQRNRQEEAWIANSPSKPSRTPELMATAITTATTGLAVSDRDSGKVVNHSKIDTLTMLHRPGGSSNLADPLWGSRDALHKTGSSDDKSVVTFAGSIVEDKPVAISGAVPKEQAHRDQVTGSREGARHEKAHTRSTFALGRSTRIDLRISEETAASSLSSQSVFSRTEHTTTGRKQYHSSTSHEDIIVEQGNDILGHGIDTKLRPTDTSGTKAKVDDPVKGIQGPVGTEKGNTSGRPKLKLSIDGDASAATQPKTLPEPHVHMSSADQSKRHARPQMSEEVQKSAPIETVKPLSAEEIAKLMVVAANSSAGSGMTPFGGQAPVMGSGSRTFASSANETGASLQRSLKTIASKWSDDRAATRKFVESKKGSAGSNPGSVSNAEFETAIFLGDNTKLPNKEPKKEEMKRIQDAISRRSAVLNDNQIRPTVAHLQEVQGTPRPHRTNPSREHGRQSTGGVRSPAGPGQPQQVTSTRFAQGNAGTPEPIASLRSRPDAHASSIRPRYVRPNDLQEPQARSGAILDGRIATAGHIPPVVRKGRGRFMANERLREQDSDTAESEL